MNVQNSKKATTAPSYHEASAPVERANPSVLGTSGYYDLGQMPVYPQPMPTYYVWYYYPTPYMSIHVQPDNAYNAGNMSFNSYDNSQPSQTSFFNAQNNASLSAFSAAHTALRCNNTGMLQYLLSNTLLNDQQLIHLVSLAIEGQQEQITKMLLENIVMNSQRDINDLLNIALGQGFMKLAFYISMLKSIIHCPLQEDKLYQWNQALYQTDMVPYLIDEKAVFKEVKHGFKTFDSFLSIPDVLYYAMQQGTLFESSIKNFAKNVISKWEEKYLLLEDSSRLLGLLLNYPATNRAVNAFLQPFFDGTSDSLITPQAQKKPSIQKSQVFLTLYQIIMEAGPCGGSYDVMSYTNNLQIGNFIAFACRAIEEKQGSIITSMLQNTNFRDRLAFDNHSLFRSAYANGYMVLAFYIFTSAPTRCRLNNVTDVNQKKQNMHKLTQSLFNVPLVVDRALCSDEDSLLLNGESEDLLQNHYQQVLFILLQINSVFQFAMQQSNIYDVYIGKFAVFLQYQHKENRLTDNQKELLMMANQYLASVDSPPLINRNRLFQDAPTKAYEPQLQADKTFQY